MRWCERITGVFISENDSLDGEEVEKITFWYPAERDPDRLLENIHFFLPQGHLQTSGTEFLTRTHWYDPQTHRTIRCRCGCIPPKHDDWCEYPEPESVPRELFQFQVPPDALLEVKDPELGRDVSSEGQTTDRTSEGDKP